MLCRSEAVLDGYVYGFSPYVLGFDPTANPPLQTAITPSDPIAEGMNIPLVPLAIFSDPTGSNPQSWEYQVESGVDFGSPSALAYGIMTITIGSARSSRRPAIRSRHGQCDVPGHRHQLWSQSSQQILKRWHEPNHQPANPERLRHRTGGLLFVLHGPGQPSFGPEHDDRSSRTVSVPGNAGGAESGQRRFRRPGRQSGKFAEHSCGLALIHRI